MCTSEVHLLHPFFGKFGWSKMKMVRLRRGRLGATPPRMSFYVGLCADKKIGAVRRPPKRKEVCLKLKVSLDNITMTAYIKSKKYLAMKQLIETHRLLIHGGNYRHHLGDLLSRERRIKNELCCC